MKFTIPQPLQHEHEALHERLRQATQVGGEVGAAAETLARLMHPHLVKEDQIALPPLGLLAALARGEWRAEMAEVLALTDQLEAELPQMLAESQRIESLVRELDRQAISSGSERFVAYLLRHCHDRTAPFVVTLPVPKAEIASQLNMSPEHFSRLLHELATAGLLQLQGRRITVPEPNRLQRATRLR